jgi:hypothetical protein
MGTPASPSVAAAAADFVRRLGLARRQPSARARGAARGRVCRGHAERIGPGERVGARLLTDVHTEFAAAGRHLRNVVLRLRERLRERACDGTRCRDLSRRLHRRLGADCQRDGRARTGQVQLVHNQWSIGRVADHLPQHLPRRLREQPASDNAADRIRSHDPGRWKYPSTSSRRSWSRSASDWQRGPSKTAACNGARLAGRRRSFRTAGSAITLRVKLGSGIGYNVANGLAYVEFIDGIGEEVGSAVAGQLCSSYYNLFSVGTGLEAQLGRKARPCARDTTA